MSSSEDLEVPLVHHEDVENSFAYNLGNGNKNIYTQVQRVTFWRWVTFSWIFQLFKIARSSERLNADKLPHLAADAMPEVCGDILWESWKQQEKATFFDSKKNPRLIWAMFRPFLVPYLRLGLLKFANDALSFVGPVVLNSLLVYLDPKQDDALKNFISPLFPRHINFGLMITAVLAVSLLLKAFCNAHYSFQQAYLSARVKGALISVMFRQTLLLPTSELSNIGTGHVQTLMSVDSDRVLGLFLGFHELWSLPLQIGIALWLLYTKVQLAFLAGLGLVLFVIFLNRFIASGIQTASVKLMEAKDRRLAKIDEIIKGIRTIKAANLETFFMARVENTRKEELKGLAVRKYLDALCVYLWAATSLLFTLGTFGLFSLSKRELTAEIVFTSLALFSVLIGPINSFPWVVNGLIEAVVSLKRVEEYLSLKPIQNLNLLIDRNPCDVDLNEEKVINEEREPVFRLDKAYFSWSPSSTNGPVLTEINLTISNGEFLIVTGEVGTGKSSLALALLGELYLQSGIVERKGKVAYCSQEPWALPMSLRDNIIMGEEMEHERYHKVLHACALLEDIERLSEGDATYIGDRGVALSGGQRARVALARAIYRKADVYILDDVLSALDSHVASWVIKNALLGDLLANKTVILTTHSPALVNSYSTILYLASGSIVDIVRPFGSSDLLRNSVNNSFSRRQDRSFDALIKEVDVPGIQIENVGSVEDRGVGYVRWEEYKRYINFQGLWVPITLISMVLMQITRNGSDMWLSYWVTHARATANVFADTFPLGSLLDLRRVNLPKFLTISEDIAVSYYLKILLDIAAANSCFTLIRAFAFAAGGLRAARLLHTSLLKSVMHLPQKFWDEMPSGRILNRFSADTATADDSLPFIANVFLAQAFSLTGISVVLGYTQPVVVGLMLPIVFIFRQLQLYYRSASRELRRLEAIARSPVHSAFSSVLSGGPTIRAHNATTTMLRAAHSAIESQQRASIASIAASSWLSLRLQLLAAGLAAVMSTLAVLEHIKVIPTIREGNSAGLLGLSLAYVLPITGILSGLLTSGAETEQEMVSVERIGHLIDMSPEVDMMNSVSSQGTVVLSGINNITRDCRSLGQWPTDGHVLFDDVWLQYKPNGPFVLQGLKLDVPPQSTVGICGRTGAGKSSAVTCLLRLADIQRGQITVDGKDVRTVSLRRLRAAIGYIPQSPFVFSGTVAENLDPFGKYTAQHLHDVLREVGLGTIFLVCIDKKKLVDDSFTKDILQLELGTNGDITLSQGQQQMLCLARVLLLCPPIYCLDESTASVDPGTATTMLSVLKERTRGKTVIQIAHQLETILGSDYVYVLDKGRVAEAGSPGELASDKCTMFSQMLVGSGT